jgi:hypothetical protein
MAGTLPPSFKQDVEAFEREFALPENVLLRVLGAYRSIVATAALQGVDAAAVAADLQIVTGSAEPGRVLTQRYESVAALVRRDAIRATLIDYGPLLDGFEWRVDHVAASSRGEGFRFGFGLLTLKYFDQGESKRLTLQLTPDMVAGLEAALAAMMGRSAAATGEQKKKPSNGA